VYRGGSWISRRDLGNALTDLKHTRFWEGLSMTDHMLEAENFLARAVRRAGVVEHLLSQHV
jgi:hypothetical protein